MRKEELLRKYLAGESSPEEEKMLYHLLLREDDPEQYREISYELWQKIEQHQALPAQQRERMYARIRETTGMQPRRQFTAYRYAAVIATVLLAAAVLYIVLQDDRVHIQTAYAQQQEIRLPDGSTVLLNANSSLTYPGDWSDQSVREVWLEGEAYFKVSKVQTADRPVRFIVHARDLQVQVLGTEFNVQNLEKEVQVVLAEGKVRLSNQAADLLLDMVPGQLVAYSAEKQQVIRKEVSTRHYTAWKDGRYIFDDMSLQEISRLISRNYGKEVIFRTPSLAEKRMSATIPSTDLEVVLAIIAETMDVRISATQDTITIGARQP